MRAIGWGLVGLAVLSILLSSCIPGASGGGCEIPAFTPPYLPGSMKIDLKGEGKEAKFVVVYTDEKGKEQRRTIYTLTWLGDHSPNNPSCDDWIPVLAGNVSFREGFLLQYQTLPELNKDVKEYKLSQYSNEYRGILNTDKRTFYGDKKSAVYTGHLLFYFADKDVCT